ncbi:TetR/AcrR family transcriptional regulator [Nesterenkonia aerolata]|uniref:Tetracyclin repressor-like C-terminal group 31 domain-containing protein n=1 Tax=Nesterenkonia aerolata TaxID=3074079 RepID=A0ABU2DPM0_9MICC|nr:hypothetical protein [Nesterenkonia sp. LY-0111]MDR8018398.1 hypothetical protein [Nesterenkonia sp. LY-0111]
MIVAVPGHAARTDRRADIAEAGIRLIAARGVRSLSHRAIDAELGLPVGSTSYYARTRYELVKLIVHRLATHTTLDTERLTIPARLTSPEAARLIAQGLRAALDRADEHRARIALHIEYRNDPEMLDALAGDPPLRLRLTRAAEELLTRLGTPRPAQHAPDLIALIDSLLMQLSVRDTSVDAQAIIRAYLDGISDPGPASRA